MEEEAILSSRVTERILKYGLSLHVYEETLEDCEGDELLCERMIEESIYALKMCEYQGGSKYIT